MIHEQVFDRYYFSFDDVADLVETCRRTPEGNLPCALYTRTESLGRRFDSWNDVYRAALSPWDEGIKLVDSMIQSLEGANLARPKSRKRKMRFDEADGDELDLDRLRDGQPFWRRSRRELTLGPQTVTIAVDVTARAEHSHKQVLWRGAVAVAMTHILEDAGFRVELWAFNKANGAYKAGGGYCLGVCLKRAGDPLDVSTTISAVSAWFYRTLMIRAASFAGKADKSMGAPATVWEDDVRQIVPGRVDYPILIAGTYTQTGALRIAKQSLESLATACAPPEPEPLPEEVEQVEIAVEQKETKPESATARKKREASERRANREYKKWAKEWAAKNRQG